MLATAREGRTMGVRGQGIAGGPDRPEEVVMKVAFRAVAVSVVLSLAWAGPLAPLATAQQPAVPPVIVVPPSQPVAPPPVYQEQVLLPPPPPSIDAYDVGAVA